jgi:formylglycine-generating enzyme required for sulfatase activity
VNAAVEPPRPISISKRIGWPRYTLFEVDAEVFDALERRGGDLGLAAAFAGVADHEHLLWRALGGHMDHERQESARLLLLDTFHAEPGAGPYLFSERFQDLQAERAFFAGYREHIAHQLKVYLLGWYLYSQCRPIRQPVDAWLRGRADRDRGELVSRFRSRWRFAALWHDIGYVFERDEVVHTGKIPDGLSDELTEFATYPLTVTLGRKGVQDLTRYDETRLHDASRQPLRVWAPLLVEQLSGQEERHLRLLDRASRGFSTRSPEPTGVADYYAFAREQGAINQRGPFYDHGIAGALLLLSVHQRLRQGCASAVSGLEHYPHYRPPEGLGRRIRELGRAVEAARPAVEDAAQAIALHNIYTEGFDPDRASARWLALQGFRMRWDDQPLAALLALCDVLQGWDRPGFQGARFSKPSMSDQELLICADDDGVHIAYHGPQAAERERQTRAALDAVLDPEFLAAWCRWDARPAEALVERALSGAHRSEVEGIRESLPDSPRVRVDPERGGEAPPVPDEGPRDPAAVTRRPGPGRAERRGRLARAVRDALGSGRVRQAQASFAELRRLDQDGAATAELERELAAPCRHPVERRIPAGVFWRGLDLRQAQQILDAVARRNYNLDLSSEEARKRFLEVLTRDPRRREAHPAFWLDRYLVTNDQFSRFVLLTGHVTELERRGWDDWLSRITSPDRMTHPVVNVSFDDALAYARWAGRRLPTCAERDRAAQGFDGRAYPWGDEYVQTNCNAADDRWRGMTCSVWEFESVESPFEVVDLVGNVDEITTDTEGPYHVAVGGSWKQACEIYGLPGFRRLFEPGAAHDDIGFRTARDDPEPSPEPPEV